jgi:malonyl CoA-acyl carrier protein transacylase
MKKILVLGIILLIAACSSKKEGNMIVTGQIKGLKKGKLYLQKIEKDTILKTIDSVNVHGSDLFTLTADVSEPEMYYLTFDGNTTNKYITFFADKGTITINDDVAKFGLNPTITGSKNQDILNRYTKISKRFNDQNLDLIEKKFRAQKANNKDSIDIIDKQHERLLRRRYMVTVNFALNNKDNHVAPYLALTQLVNANVKWLDTINNSLAPNVKSSLYGKKLDKFIADIKKAETKK